MKRIIYTIVATITLFSYAPNIYSQTEGEGSGEETVEDYTISGVLGLSASDFTTGSFQEKNNVGFSKEISRPVNGKYYIKLEAYATGTATVTSVSKPADIILVLDYSTSMDNSRRRALRTAVQAFLTTIYNNDRLARDADSGYAGDRVAIISFNSSATTRYHLTQINTGYNTMYSYFNSDFGTGSYTNSGAGLSSAMKEWQSASGDPTTDNTRTRAVVVFTDGCPSHSGSYAFDCDYAKSAIDNSNILKSDYGASVYAVGLFSTSHSSWSVIGQSVLDYMNFMSSNFSGVESTATTGGSASGNTPGINGTITYSFDNVEGVSSLSEARSSDNYIDADEAQANPDNSYFFMASDVNSLESIFKKIASQTGGSANTSLSSSTSTVDVVSSSFDLPDGNATEIYVFTAPYEMQEDRTPAFGVETLSTHSTDLYDEYDSNGNLLRKDVDVDNAITYTVTNNKIEVKGFDYSNNWCGPIKNASQQIIGYRGHKLIIIIPIKMSDNAVGGPNVSTNAPGSGIFASDDDTEPLISFESPKVSLPVNVHISKDGLEEGESAKYSLMRAVLPTNSDGTINWPDQPTKNDYDGLTWTYVTSVFVTRSEGETGDPMVKIIGLPSKGSDGNYIYKVVEDDWSWSWEFVNASGIGYKYETVDGKTNKTIDTITVTDKDYITTDKFISNPIKFKNQKDSSIDVRIRHAESKANNIFLGSGSVTYDDSKDNGRSSSGVTK